MKWAGCKLQNCRYSTNSFIASDLFRYGIGYICRSECSDWCPAGPICELSSLRKSIIIRNAFNNNSPTLC